MWVGKRGEGTHGSALVSTAAFWGLHNRCDLSCSHMHTMAADRAWKRPCHCEMTEATASAAAKKGRAQVLMRCTPRHYCQARRSEAARRWGSKPQKHSLCLFDAQLISVSHRVVP